MRVKSGGVIDWGNRRGSGSGIGLRGVQDKSDGACDRRSIEDGSSKRESDGGKRRVICESEAAAFVEDEIFDSAEGGFEFEAEVGRVVDGAETEEAGVERV